MGVYHTTGELNKSGFALVVPDAFLSVGVERKKGGKSRRSYVMWEDVMWEEDYTPPLFVLEMVSHAPGGEYNKKMAIYAQLGVLYYLVYNPEFYRRDRHEPFEVYKLEDGEYRRQSGEPFWMPEVGLGIGRDRGEVGGIAQEMPIWCDAQGNRFPSAVELERERAELERDRALHRRDRADREREAKERLDAYLRTQGIDPEQLS